MQPTLLCAPSCPQVGTAPFASSRPDAAPPGAYPSPHDPHRPHHQHPNPHLNPHQLPPNHPLAFLSKPRTVPREVAGRIVAYLRMALGALARSKGRSEVLPIDEVLSGLKEKAQIDLDDEAVISTLGFSSAQVGGGAVRQG